MEKQVDEAVKSYLYNVVRIEDGLFVGLVKEKKALCAVGDSPAEALSAIKQVMADYLIKTKRSEWPNPLGETHKKEIDEALLSPEEHSLINNPFRAYFHDRECAYNCETCGEEFCFLRNKLIFLPKNERENKACRFAFNESF